MIEESVATGLAVRLNVNGRRVRVRTDLLDTLLTVLRDQLMLTATKRGCNQGVCGACTVRIDGETMRSCLTLTQNCTEAKIMTLEGLQNDPRMHALQQAFAVEGAYQCGFCTSGMLITAYSLLECEPDPDEPAIRRALSGNLCRCTGYVKIIAAVRRAAATLLEQKDGAS